MRLIQAEHCDGGGCTVMASCRTSALLLLLLLIPAQEFFNPRLSSKNPQPGYFMLILSRNCVLVLRGY